MFHTTPLAAITAALVLVSKPETWTCYSSARRIDGASVPSYHRDATCFCASGALRRAVVQPGVYIMSCDTVDYDTEIKVSNLLDAEVRRRYPGRYADSDVALYVDVNDEPELGREVIVEIFQAVQAQLERQQLVEQLIAARALIADKANWTQTRLARDEYGTSVDPSVPDACRFCAVGAAIRVVGDQEPATAMVNVLDKAAWRLFKRLVVDVNDARGHAETLRVYDEAIAVARIGTLVG